jgi:hypothetical protein
VSASLTEKDRKTRTYGFGKPLVMKHEFLILFPSGNEIVWNAVEDFAVDLGLVDDVSAIFRHVR